MAGNPKVSRALARSLTKLLPQLCPSQSWGPTQVRGLSPSGLGAQTSWSAPTPPLDSACDP